MLKTDFYEATVSGRVSERADQLAATAHGVRYGYLDSPRLVDTPTPGQALQLWRADATYGWGKDAHHVEVTGGFHPDTSPLQLGPATAWCNCTGHAYRRLCAHVVATWRRALLDHQTALDQVAV